MKGLKGEKGDTGRGSAAGISGMDASGFPAGFVEGPQGPPGRKVRAVAYRTDCTHTYNACVMI